jgi:hypothetical protein
MGQLLVRETLHIVEVFHEYASIDTLSLVMSFIFHYETILDVVL